MKKADMNWWRFEKLAERFGSKPGDRLFGRAKEMEFVVFDSTSRENELREKNWNMNLQKAYEKGNKLFMEGN